MINKFIQTIGYIRASSIAIALIILGVKGFSHVVDIDVGCAGAEQAREAGNLPDWDRNEQNREANERCGTDNERSGDSDRAAEYQYDNQA